MNKKILIKVFEHEPDLMWLKFDSPSDYDLLEKAFERCFFDHMDDGCLGFTIGGTLFNYMFDAFDEGEFLQFVHDYKSSYQKDAHIESQINAFEHPLHSTITAVA